MKTWKRIAAIGITLGMLISGMPVSVYADDMIVEDDTYIVVEDDTEAVLEPEVDSDFFDDALITDEDDLDIEYVEEIGPLTDETEEELYAAEGDIPINAVNFPDEVFRNLLCSNEYDRNEDGVLSADEIELITNLEIPDYSGCETLDGIEFLTSLEVLICNDCYPLSELDVSKNTELRELYCYRNNLTSLDVSKNTKLERLECWNNELTSLDLSKNTELRVLYCFRNELTSLDVSKNTKLELLYCGINQLPHLELGRKPVLQRLECEQNQITTLDITKCPKLNYVYYHGNSQAYDDLVEYRLEISNPISNDYQYRWYSLKVDEEVTLVVGDEDPTTISNRYIIGKDTWYFKNPSSEIKFSHYHHWFNAAYASFLYDREPWSDGLCFGCSILIPSIIDYNIPFALGDADIHDYDPEDVMDYLILGQIYQYTFNAAVKIKLTKGNLNGLCEAVREEVYNQGLPVCIQVFNPGKHEVLATSIIKDTPEEFIIGVYDCNFPDNKYIYKDYQGNVSMKDMQIYPSVRLYGEDGHYTQCEYGISETVDGEWTWRTNGNTHESLYWDITDSVWFYNLIDVFCADFVASLPENKISTPLIAIVSGLLDCAGDAIKIDVAKGGGEENAADLYWVEDSDGDLNITDVNANDEIQVALDNKYICLSSETDSDFRIDFSEDSDYVEVTINSDSDNGARCVYMEVQPNDDVVQTDISLQGENSVSFKINSDEIITNGITGLDVEQVNGRLDDDDGELIGETVFSESGIQIDPGADYVVNIDKNTTEVPKSVSLLTITGIVNKTYTGKAITQKVVVKDGSKTLIANTDYKVSYKNNINAGTATVTITGIGKYTDSVRKTFKIAKSANKITALGKTVKVKKKKKQTIKPAKYLTINNAKGNLTYKLTGINKKKFKKFFKVNAKNGNITVKKGLKKGTYKLNITVTAAGNGNYLPGTKQVTVTIKAK